MRLMTFALFLLLGLLASCSEASSTPIAEGGKELTRANKNVSTTKKQKQPITKHITFKTPSAAEAGLEIRYRVRAGDFWDSELEKVILPKGAKKVDVTITFPDEYENKNMQRVATMAEGFEPVYTQLHYKKTKSEIELSPLVTHHIVAKASKGADPKKRVQFHVYAPFYPDQNRALFERYLRGEGQFASNDGVFTDDLDELFFDGWMTSIKAFSGEIGIPIKIDGIASRGEVSVVAMGRGIGSKRLVFPADSKKETQEIEVYPATNYEVKALLRGKDGKTRPAIGAELTYNIKGNTETKTVLASDQGTYYLFQDDWKRTSAEEIVIEATWEDRKEVHHYSTKKPHRIQKANSGDSFEVVLDELNSFVFRFADASTHELMKKFWYFDATLYPITVYANDKEYELSLDEKYNSAILVTEDEIKSFKIKFAPSAYEHIKEESRKSLEAMTFDFKDGRFQTLLLQP